MNDQMLQFARTTLKDGFSQLPEAYQLMFKRMYSHANLELPIDEVVELVPEEKLDWAMQQVERSLSKLSA